MRGLDWPKDGRHIFAGGAWIEVDSTDPIPAISPIDESVVGQVPAAGAADLDRAVELIKPALAAWRALGPNGRAPYLEKFAQRIEEHADELVYLEVIDSGKTIESAQLDVKAASASLRFNNSYAGMIRSEIYPSAEGTLNYTVREPYGIVAQVIPFNHPVAGAVSCAAPGLLTGNAVIVKPPEQASLSTLAVAEVAREVFPPGIYNVISGHGYEIGNAILAHPDIPRIGFTGSIPTGRRVLEGSAGNIKHATLELGGKNPLLATSTADPTLVADFAVSGMNFFNTGQSCHSTSRVLLHRSLHDEVVEGIAKRIGALVVGNPFDERTQVGPLCFREHYERVLNYISIGIDEGAKLEVGGRRPPELDKGFYVEPTLFSQVTPEMRIAREEIFGPVVAVFVYDDLDDAIALANATEFGLVARVMAGTLDEATAIGRQMQAGTVLLNAASHRPLGMPFGGFKQSGLGVRSCLEDVLSYTQVKSVCASVD
jgi:betaine-aldehyde dehydrogenase